MSDEVKGAPAPQPVVNAEAGNAANIEQPISDIPQDLQGKTPHELADIIANQRDMINRQGNEVGELRSMVSQQITARETVPQFEAEDVDFYNDPERYIDRIMESKLRPFNNALHQQTQAQVKQRLDQEFPGWDKTVQDQGFTDWVKASPVRSQLFQAADRADYASAAELLGTWKQLSGVKESAARESEKAVSRDRKLRAVKSEKAGGQLDPRKIFNRVDLQQLKQRNPDRYNALLPDIKRAYAEGRVR